MDGYVTKGTRVRFSTMTASLPGEPWSLAGAQFKLPVKVEEFEGVVRHVWTDDPEGTKNVRVQVELDDGTLREAPFDRIVGIVGIVTP